MSVPTLLAAGVQPADPKIEAWITPVTLFPTGLAFSIFAQSIRPGSERIIPYFVSAKLRVDEDAYEIGGSTRATATTALVSFWLPESSLPGGLERLRESRVAIDVYEGSDRQTATRDRALVQAVNVDIS